MTAEALPTPARRIAATLVLLPLIAASAARTSAQELSVVEVSFETSPSVAAALGDDLATFEAAMTDAFAGVAKARFSFVDWAAGTSATGPRLVARMVETESFCEPILELELAYVLFSTENSFPDLADPLLYSSCDADRSLQSEEELARFETRIVETLDEFFDTDAERAAIQAVFLSEVRLSDRLEVDHQVRAVLMPFAWSQLEATDQSELKVAFAFRMDPTDPSGRPGTFRMRPWVELDGKVQCEIKPFTFGDLVDVPSQTDYHDDLANLFNDQLAEMSVYMVKYFRDPHATLRTPGGEGLRAGDDFEVE